VLGVLLLLDRTATRHPRRHDIRTHPRAAAAATVLLLCCRRTSCGVRGAPNRPRPLLLLLLVRWCLAAALLLQLRCRLQLLPASTTSCYSL
jgi:hypothetical protein